MKDKTEKLTEAKKQQGQSTGSLKDQLMGMVPGLGAAVAAYQGLSAAISTAKQFMDESLEAYRVQEESNARLATVITATGASAWTTARQMDDFSRDLADSTGRSKQEIQDMNAVLLGFTSITGDKFKEASAAIVQMSGVMGGDLKAAANAFGKALDTPAESLSTLSRYGFKFSEDAQATVQAMEDIGDHAAAQNVILEAMTTSFGDAATAVNQAAQSQNNYNTAIANLKAAAGKPLEEAIRPLRDLITLILNKSAGAITNINDTKDALERLKNADYDDGFEGQIQKRMDFIKKYQAEIKKLEDDAKAQGLMNPYSDGKPDAEAAARIAQAQKMIAAIEEEIQSLEQRQAAEQEAAAEAIRNAGAITAAETKAEDTREKARLAAQKAADEQAKRDKSMAGEAQRYREALEDLAVKNDDIANDERQLLELNLARKKAAIEASEASEEEKQKTLAALKELYTEQMRLADEAFANKNNKSGGGDDNENKTLAERLAATGKTEAQSYNEREAAYKKFLLARVDAENLTGDERVARMKEYAARIQTDESLEYWERGEALNVFNEAVKEAEEEAKQERIARAQETAQLIMDVVSSMTDLTRAVNARKREEEETEAQTAYDAEIARLEAEAARKKEVEDLSAEELKAIDADLAESKKATKEKLDAELAAAQKKEKERNRAAAVADRVVSIAQATIQAGLAVTKALASAPPPANFVLAGAVGTAAALQTAAMIATPIPSAETGGRFVVPDTSPGVDGVGFMVNPGEEIDVTPRGMSGAPLSVNLNLIWDMQVLARAINYLARAGELNTLQLAGNL